MIVDSLNFCFAIEKLLESQSLIGWVCWNSKTKILNFNIFSIFFKNINFSYCGTRYARTVLVSKNEYF